MAAAESDRTALLEGHATHRLAAAAALPGRPQRLALAHAYLGDVALASVPAAGQSIAVEVERYYRRRFAHPLRIAIGAGPVSALTATMDYRSDVLVAWQQDGSIYAHMLRASGRPEPTQRVGASAPDPQLQALVSDDNHGMIAWSSTSGHGRRDAKTRVYLALSGTGVRFRGERLIASYADPSAAGREPGALALVRLARENVMLAWTGVQHGHYVVLAAPAVFAAVRPATRLTPVTDQSVLAALAPGAANEAIAVWRRAVPHGSAIDWRHSQLWAARTAIDAHGSVGFLRPGMLGWTGSDAQPALAVDPGDDRAVAAWTAPGVDGATYAVGPTPPDYRHRAFALPTAAAGAGVHWLRITLAVIAAASAAAAVLALRARRRGRAQAPSH